MPPQSPSEDRDEEESRQPHTKDKQDRKETHEAIESEPKPSEIQDKEAAALPLEEETEQEAQVRRIRILEEREIPFVEEKPPNFSPNFKIHIHRIRNKEKSRKEKE